MDSIFKLDPLGFVLEGPLYIDAADGCPEGWLRWASLPEPPEGAPHAQLVGGAWVYSAEGPPPAAPAVPIKIHKLWVTIVLIASDEIDDVEDVLDAEWSAGNKSYRRYWNAVGDIFRADPILAAFATRMAWSAGKLDQIFIQAAAYEAAASVSD